MIDNKEAPRTRYRMPIAPLAVWRYAVLFSLVVTVLLFGLASLWLWHKNHTAPGGLASHMIESGAIAFVGVSLAIVWQMRRR
jgi:hypothetical protein